MNKIFKKMAILCCAAFLFTGLTACKTISAYEIAVENGYQGTEEEWLKSLHGEDGKDGEDGQDLTASDLYETAKENGYEGTYLEFCQDILQVDVSKNNDLDTLANNVTSVVSVRCGFSQTRKGSKDQVKEYGWSAGSGVIVELNKAEGDALVITNYHVVYYGDSDQENGISDSIYLYTYGAYSGFALQDDGYADESGDGIKATYVGGAMDYDIAILRIEDSEYLKNHPVSAATFANSDEVRMGEKVYAIGNPGDKGISVTEGVISVETEYLEMESMDGSNSTVDYRVMRTDAAINSGNSGGALFNAEGGLIGIVNAKDASSDADNMGYALPSTQVYNLYKNILANDVYGDKAAHVATLGVMVSITDTESYFDEDGALRIREEITVAQMAASGAATSVLAVGDVLKGIQVRDGEWVTFTRQYQLLDQLLTVRKGDSVKLKILRDGTEMTVDVTFSQDAHFTVYA